MPSRRLSDAFVRNVRPPDQKAQRQVTYIDTIQRGLALLLVVSYGGTKTFRVLTYVNGQAKSRKLGTYPSVSVKDARELARDYWLNPKKFVAQVESDSFKETTEAWIRRHVDARGLRSKHEIERYLRKYVFPRWKDLKFVDIRRREVNELLDYIADHHGKVQADAVLATLRGLMGWYQSRDEHYTSPIVRGMRRSSPIARSRILYDEEIRAVWVAAGECGSFGNLVKMLLLAAQRKHKVSTMCWKDVVDGEWTIPSEVREKGTAGSITLTPAAMQIISQQLQVVGNPFVFPGRGKRLQRLLPPEARNGCPASRSGAWTLI